MTNIDVDDIRRKITDEEYLKRLITKIHDNNDYYQYPSEFSELMINIKTLYDEAIRNHTELPFTYGDFYLFLNGTVASLFKGNVSRTADNNFRKAYECDKLSNLAHLPREISIPLFEQDDIIDALEGTTDLATHHVCMTGGMELAIVIANKFAGRIPKLDDELFMAKRQLNELDLVLNNIQSSEPNDQMDEDSYLDKYDEASNKYNTQYEEVLGLEYRKMICSKLYKFALSFASEVVKNRYLSVNPEGILRSPR